VMVLGPNHFATVAAAHFKPTSLDSLGECIHLASQQEAEVIEGLKSIDKKAPKALTDGTVLWEEEDGYVYYKGKLYIPNIRELC